MGRQLEWICAAGAVLTGANLALATLTGTAPFLSSTGSSALMVAAFLVLLVVLDVARRARDERTAFWGRARKRTKLPVAAKLLVLASVLAGFFCATAGHLFELRPTIRVEQAPTPPGTVPARPYFVVEDPAKHRRETRGPNALTLPVYTLAFVIALRERRRGVLL